MFSKLCSQVGVLDLLKFNILGFSVFRVQGVEDVGDQKLYVVSGCRFPDLEFGIR